MEPLKTLVKKTLSIVFLTGILFAGNNPLRAAENDLFSGRVSAEEGGFQSPGSAVGLYKFSQLTLESHQDVLAGLTLGLEGEADWQSSDSPMAPTWPLAFPDNILKLETGNLSSSDGKDLYLLRLSRAYLHLASGPLDVTAGLFKSQWGSSYFYRPTDYFFPLSPLQWKEEEAPGSEGMDASCFLFDDLSLEGAVRWLSGGTAEGLVKVVDKGIGLTVTPSLAWMTGRNGFGLELVGTFPTFQVRLEAVDWLYADGQATTNWILGLSTSHEEVKYTAEVLWDETGEILGGYSGQASQATYVFLSAEGKFFGDWKASPALVAAVEGGPFLFWPKLGWNFKPGWELGFQAQALLGNWKGPLDLYPGRAGLSISYSF
jgi:hypothetical protein